MNRLNGQGNPPAAAEAAAQGAEVWLRRVHRAVSDLRRAIPVLLIRAEGQAPLVVLAAEQAQGGLEEFARVAGPEVRLLLAPVRAAAVLHRKLGQAGTALGPEPVALKLTAALMRPDALLSLADPTASQVLPDAPEATDPVPGAVAALALAKLARLLPAVLVAQARPGAETVVAQRGLLSVPARDVLAYPAGAAAGLTQVAAAAVPLQDAPDARIVAFRSPDAAIEHLAILIGDPAAAESPLVRIHSECFTGDLLGSLRCDCGPQLRGAIQRMAAEGSGVLLYLAQEGRGIGLINKLRAYTLQDRGLDTLDANRALGWAADERNFLTAATMLHALGVNRVRLLTNNPEKLAGLAACGIEVSGRVSHIFAANGVNDKYLATKAARFGHLLG